MKRIFIVVFLAILFIIGLGLLAGWSTSFANIQRFELEHPNCPEYSIIDTERYVCSDIDDDFCFKTRLVIKGDITEEEALCIAERRVIEMTNTQENAILTHLEGEIAEITIWIWDNIKDVGKTPYTVAQVVWKDGKFKSDFATW